MVNVFSGVSTVSEPGRVDWGPRTVEPPFVDVEHCHHAAYYFEVSVMLSTIALHELSDALCGFRVNEECLLELLSLII